MIWAGLKLHVYREGHGVSIENRHITGVGTPVLMKDEEMVSNSHQAFAY
jgi:hypothetical protein